MKVFISWSGDLSKEVAIIIREWLPSVIQAIVPYVSSEDIRKGNRWSSDISRELEASTFGIVVLTPDNLDAPWINFEAGALTKTVDRSSVSPFLFGVKNSEIKGPLTQFQTTAFERQEIHKLIVSMNNSMGEGSLDEGRLAIVFEKWWPDLEEKLSPLLSKVKEKKPSSVKKSDESNSSEVLEEILKLTRSQQQLLTNPEQLLPRDYMNDLLLKSRRGRDAIPAAFVFDFQEHQNELNVIIDNVLLGLPAETFELKHKEELVQGLSELRDKVNDLSKFINFLKRRISIGKKFD